MKKVDEKIFMHLADIVINLKPAQEPISDADPYESVNFDHMTKDNSAWMMFSKVAIMEQRIIINR